MQTIYQNVSCISPFSTTYVYVVLYLVGKEIERNIGIKSTISNV